MPSHSKDMAKKKNQATSVELIRHKDKRKNIPTEELRDFMADEELAPITRIIHGPRDPLNYQTCRKHSVFGG